MQFWVCGEGRRNLRTALTPQDFQYVILTPGRLREPQYLIHYLCNQATYLLLGWLTNWYGAFWPSCPYVGDSLYVRGVIRGVVMLHHCSSLLANLTQRGCGDLICHSQHFDSSCSRICCIITVPSSVCCPDDVTNSMKRKPYKTAT